MKRLSVLLLLPMMATAGELEQGQAIAAEFKGELMQTLKSAIAEGGPVNGISVCNSAAGPLADAVAQRHGVSLGRVGTRTRSPANEPQPWQAELVAAVEKDPRPQMLEIDGHQLYAEPLFIQEPCLACHGEPKDDVKAALNKYYPNDKATGYALGDLRGVLWVKLGNQVQ
ncbi:MAG: DUF3365 domain-containing protein [Oceanospirillaceae bacterium]|nr:DUF3365 domain-containing protein [Oceanospirillaceae bacterium]